MPRTRTNKRRPARKPRQKRVKRVSKRGRTHRNQMSGPFHAYVVGDPFKPFMMTKLHYSETFTFTTGTSGVYGVEQIMRLNSLFDPNFTGIGHQPYGTDQLALLYRRYKIHAVQLTLIWTDPTNDGTVVAAQLQPPFGTFTLAGKAIDVVKEQPMSVTRIINNTGSQTRIIKQYIPLHTVAGLSSLQYKADMTDFSAPFSASPAQVPLLRFSAASARGLTGATILCRCEMIFFTQVYDRIVLVQS